MERGRSKGPQHRTVTALADALALEGDARKQLVELARDGRLRDHWTRPAGLCELPRLVDDFTGRAAELAWTSELVSAGSAPGAGAAGLISGSGGMGKTTLVIRAAHVLRPDFPGGVFFLDLFGMSPRPAAAADALRLLLRALGVADEQIPEDVAGRASRSGCRTSSSPTLPGGYSGGWPRFPAATSTRPSPRSWARCRRRSPGMPWTSSSTSACFMTAPRDDTGSAPDTGESVSSLIADPPPDAPVPPILPPVDGFLVLDRGKFAASFAADVPEKVAAFMADSQVPAAVDALNGAVTEPAWRSKPSWYLVATDDQMIPPAAQRAMGERAKATVTETPGSHAVFVSRPAVVAAVISQAAKA